MSGRWKASVSMLLVAVIGAPFAGAILSSPLAMILPAPDILKLYAPVGLALGTAGGALSLIYYNFRLKFDALDALIIGFATILSLLSIGAVVEFFQNPASFNVQSAVIYLIMLLPAAIVFGGLPAVMLYFVWAKLADWLGCKISSGSNRPLPSIGARRE